MSGLLAVLLSASLSAPAAVDASYWAERFPRADSESAVTLAREYAVRRPYAALWTRRAAADECDFSRGVTVCDEYSLVGDLGTVRDDLDRFLAETGLGKGGLKLTLRRGPVADLESCRLDVAKDGVTLVAGDDDGIRRGVCFLERQLLASPAPALRVGSTVRKPWLKTRFSRSFFGAINRWPSWTDELMDDVDYYPDALLNELAHEGVNAIWLTVQLKNVASTTLAPRSPDVDRRIAKLRRVAAKVRRYGMRLWVFGIEPHCLTAGDPRNDPKTDPMLRAHPEAYRKDTFSDFYVMCPCEAWTQWYLREMTADLFRHVPELAGIVNISQGERYTTCFSRLCPTPEGEGGGPAKAVVERTCPKCAATEPWRVHELFASAVVEGMRRGNPDARFVSWFYMPQRVAERHDWVYEVPKHVPDGVTLMFNFESGLQERQLGRIREGGDYWLSHVGPSQAFRRMAANGITGAKLQVGCDFGLGTIPQVTCPALLYRKYRALHVTGVDTVLKNWLIGDCPGLQNQAAGELAFETFEDGEDAFLRRLAAPIWGADRAEAVAKILLAYSEAYRHYPLSMLSQYYSPVNEGVAWPLYPDIEMAPLMPSWKPHNPPCGDTVGEAFDNHTLDEALVLLTRMCELPDIESLPETTTVQRREKNILRAIACHFRSARHALEFYRARRLAISASRDRGDARTALGQIGRMREIVRDEVARSLVMRELSTRDRMIGYHSEAEFHRYSPAVFDWRTNELAWAESRLRAIAADLSAGRAWPLSARERTAETCTVNGGTIVGEATDFQVGETGGVLRVSGVCRGRPSGDRVDVAFMNTTASEHPIAFSVTPNGLVPYRNGWAEVGCDPSMFRATVVSEGDGWRFSVELDARLWNDDPALCPAWLSVQRLPVKFFWPKTARNPFWRLRLGPTGDAYARLTR